MIVLLTIIGFLALSLCVLELEHSSGHLGDYSMVPGILVIGTIVVIALSLLTGHLVIK